MPTTPISSCLSTPMTRAPASAAARDAAMPANPSPSTSTSQSFSSAIFAGTSGLARNGGVYSDGLAAVEPTVSVAAFPWAALSVGAQPASPALAATAAAAPSPMKERRDSSMRFVFMIPSLVSVLLACGPLDATANRTVPPRCFRKPPPKAGDFCESAGLSHLKRVI